MIHIYYGFGKGKTTCAIGLGVRSSGAGLKTVLVQFLKDNKSNELKTVPFEMYNAPNSLPFSPDKSYQEWVNSAIEYVKKTDADVIILDEFLDIIDKFISLDDALMLINSINSELVITGHRKIDELFDIADYITFFEKIKHPYDKGIGARAGIEY